ncbi:nucleotidyltransferase domain-containing protein [Propionivibrio sp.]|uniref:nucleotidyltransferase domain-containing protein n=1 Tax=Propionivibrio sp. TaxID=2212460 RepID=UPI0025CDEE3C|nr:nucleotidyltransferase domain-containing protein [Propionivibrio sp.]MBK7357399.1 nucleotidyltransferase domain-containing protein [Propionivibrio sp.]MBK8743246.1 nucleotidyltransferase domain-containing protein [Propionivibrio sp.]
MRLTNHQAVEIVKLACQITQRPVVVRVFGSRLDDDAKGGDLDLLIELDRPVANPALLSAQLSAEVSRLIDGRKVDVLLTVPNLLRLPIHDVAIREGQPL